MVSQSPHEPGTELELPSTRVELLHDGYVIYGNPPPPASLEGELREPPQWVILGIRVGNGVAVLASSTLDHAELRRRFELEMADTPFGKVRLQRERNALLVKCQGFSFVYGETYESALRSLGTVWQPPELEAQE